MKNEFDSVKKGVEDITEDYQKVDFVKLMGAFCEATSFNQPKPAPTVAPTLEV